MIRKVIYPLSKIIIGGIIRKSMEIKCFYYDGEKLNPTKEISLPKNEPIVVACNHISYLDPVVVAIALNRHTSFIANEKFFIGIRRYYLQTLGIIRNDRNCIKNAVKLLKKKEVVVIFPEGTRSVTGEIRDKLYTGVARIATMGDAKIYPVAIKGTYEVCPKALDGKGEKIPDLKTKPPVLLSYGEPFYFTEVNRSDKKLFQEMTKNIMDKVKEMKDLLEEIYQEEKK